MTGCAAAGCEGATLLVALIGLSQVGLNTGSPLSYVVFPALIWAALRFGPRGATLAILVVSGFAIWGTTHFNGPFAFTRFLRGVLAHPAVHRRGCAVDADARRRGVRAPGARCRNAGSRLRLIAAGQIAPASARTRSARRRPATADRPRGASRPGERRVGQGPSRAQGLLDEARGELSVAIDELRALADGIRPPVLAQFGLAAAVKAIAASASLPVHVQGTPEVRLDDGAESTAYFVLAEPLANAQKYAHASRVAVDFTEHSGQLALVVVDDGVGGAVETPGLGLEGLRDRVEGLGGSFEVDSRPGLRNACRCGDPGAPAS